MEKTPRAILFLLLLLLVDLGAAQNTTGKAAEFHVGVIDHLGGSLLQAPSITQNLHKKTNSSNQSFTKLFIEN